MLEQNYRSTQTILDAANAVIDHNTARKPKHLWTDQGRRRAASSGTTPRTRTTRPLGGAADRPTCTSARAYRWGDIAVFYRTNAQSRALEEALVRMRRSPTRWSGGTRFYDRREVKDALAYLRVVVNPADEVSVKRVVNVPKRGVGDTVGGPARRLRPRPRASPSPRPCAGPTRRV